MKDDFDRPSDPARRAPSPSPSPKPKAPSPSPSPVLQSGSESDSGPRPQKSVTKGRQVHPLHKYTLRGSADALEARAAQTKPLLGTFILDGQATMIYAAPNTGKTLIVSHLLLEAIEKGRIDPDKVFYFNADDGSQGLAVKARLFQDAGAHMLAPGLEGLRTAHLPETMTQAADDGSAHGTVIIIDTLKKFTDPMDKKRSSEFAQVCREYVMAGGTIIALGHTRKNPKADGTPQYQGTTDILEDFDAVYIAQACKTKGANEHRLVQFTAEKRRANSPERVVYAYASGDDLTYEEKLISVREVDPDDFEPSALDAGKSHPQVMEAIVQLIAEGQGNDGQMALVRRAAERAGVSQRFALEVLQDYTGTVPNQHLWNFTTGPRGVRMYSLTPKA